MSATSKLEQSNSFQEIRYEYTPCLPQVLEHLGASIIVTTYQAGKLLVLGSHQNKLHVSLLDYSQPMGIAVSKDCIAIGTRQQVHFLAAADEVLSPESNHDACFVPRSSHYTGSIQVHDLAWSNQGLFLAAL